MNAIVISVNYGDLLAITLPRTLKHFETVTVVTDHRDSETCEVASELPVNLVMTDEFYDNNDVFNKGRVLDLELTIAEGWTCVLDADVLLPEKIDWEAMDPRFLHSPYRRMLVHPSEIPDESEWQNLPPGPEAYNFEYAGYFHAFHMDSLLAIKPRRPWYESPYYTAANGCDTVFWQLRGSRLCRRPGFEVLHLGPPRMNWFGRISPRWRTSYANKS